jgi:hypothetical protein
MDTEITKKVELLRALLRTKDQFDELIDTGANEEFTDKDKEFMEEFKKIYYSGLEQLEKFINKIDEEGKEISIESIEYYKNLLFNGPLAGNYVSLTRPPEGVKKFFKDTTDDLGTNGNTAADNNSIPLWSTNIVAFNNTVASNNKSTDFINDLIATASKQTAITTKECSEYLYNTDNTKPYIDKRQDERVSMEGEDGFNTESHGCYCVKDVEFRKVAEEITEDIFDKVEEYLGESDFAVFTFKKLSSYFGEDNKAKSFNAKVKRKLQFMQRSYDEKGIEKIEIKDTNIETDLFGNQFDSADRRKFTFKISGEKDKIFNPNTIEGQLGSGDEVKEDPIAD